MDKSSYSPMRHIASDLLRTDLANGKLPFSGRVVFIPDLGLAASSLRAHLYGCGCEFALGGHSSLWSSLLKVVPWTYFIRSCFYFISMNGCDHLYREN